MSGACIPNCVYSALLHGNTNYWITLIFLLRLPVLRDTCLGLMEANCGLAFARAGGASTAHPDAEAAEASGSSRGCSRHFSGDPTAAATTAAAATAAAARRLRS